LTHGLNGLFQGMVLFQNSTASLLYIALIIGSWKFEVFIKLFDLFM